MRFSTPCKARASTLARLLCSCASADATCTAFFATHSIKKGG